MRLLGPTAAVLMSSALLAGCGSYTKADFTAGADAICASTVRQTRTIALPSSGNGPVQRLRALGVYLTGVLPVVQSEAKQIRALRRPTEGARDAALLAHYRAALSQVVGDYAQLAAAAKQGDWHGAASAESALRASPVTALAASYGLRSCAAPGATVA